MILFLITLKNNYRRNIKMKYVFTFIGEFGYEMLNWQGTIRKWATKHKKENDEIIVCSRKGLEIMYETADWYLDISELDSMQNVVADCYWSYVFVDGTHPDLPREQWKIQRKGEHIENIKNEIKNLLEEELKNDYVKWIWSCDYQELDGCQFGLIAPGGNQGGIYNSSHNQLDVNNNVYKKFSLNTDKQKIRKKVESKLGFSLDEDYILCQTGFRKGYEHTKVRINHEKIIDNLSKDCKIVLMDFNTNRLHDSYSKFDTNFDTIKVDNIKEQALLIENSKKCVFFSEGVLRSHTYLPPMFGKDVEVIAPKEIFSKTDAPVKFWNENVFKFGGQMIPKPYEDIL
tara:strand:- start:194 stop:1222 length:1029 start_codon:yes stop_codon:yes gene_type:complete